MRHIVRSWPRDGRGVAAVEFAFVAPILIMLLAGIVDLGFAFERSLRLATAAQAAAQHLLGRPADLEGATAVAAAEAGQGASVSILALPCQCPAANGSPGPTVDCATTCPTGVARYLRVTVTRPFEAVFPTSSLIPFNAIGATHAQVVVRTL